MNYSKTARPRTSRWGQVDSAKQIIPGFWEVHTPGHGGYIISQERLDAMPPRARRTPYSSGGQFEEDCDWVLPVMAFADELSAAGHEDLVTHAKLQFDAEVVRGYFSADIFAGGSYRGSQI